MFQGIISFRMVDIVCAIGRKIKIGLILVYGTLGIRRCIFTEFTRTTEVVMVAKRWK